MRKVLWAVLAIGVMLIAAPFVIGLPGKAAGGQRMIDNFAPVMDQANVDKTASYYYDVFVPLGQVAPAFNDETVARFEAYLSGLEGMQTDAANLVPGLAQALGMTPEQVQAFLATEYPAMSQMLAGLPQMQEDFGSMVGMMSANTEIFGQVPAGLEHYRPLVEAMQENVDNYDKVSSLPDFRLFTWFFVVPGVALVILAVVGLVLGRKEREGAAPATPSTTDREAQPV
jgi:hypothetical protein